ncbi:hypothetical protein [Cryobacterium sp. PH31-O1]|uniref:hypothetical protein n=1 Tax=Cryobacterium sp. PH31-O1 TaxID=3046306 RepID=UPI0024B9653D|nr:hypothetical protein [Cryobacterium sp. PH31-O1]MDJ0336643.1 hypothetical protein [Cryobacterium sp. PH31-O1]
MKKWSRAIAPIILSVAASVAAFVFDDLFVALALIALALMAAFALPSVLGSVSRRSATEDVDVAKVKAYRQAHTNSTIMEAINATDRPAQS